MAKLFNKKREKLVSEKPSVTRTSNYLKYAIGEIVLVVIGILIALQINNSNDVRKSRESELHYLKNIKSDAQLNITELNNFLDTRNQLIASAKKVIEHFEGKPITSYAEFNELCIPIYAWKKFYQSNNTFQELVNSGNLALINNDSIKNTLLNIELQYKKLKSEEDYRTPIAESEQFYAALKLENVETAMVRIPGASHSIANKPSNLIAKMVSILAWFDKYKDKEEIKG